MEDNRENIFRKVSLDRVNSPDQLDAYIRVANPSVWLVLIAIVILLVSMIVWGVYGTLETTIAETFYIENGTAMCCMSDISDVSIGCDVRFSDRSVGTVTGLSETPYSSAEIANAFPDDYTRYMLGVEDWNYLLTVSAEGQRDGLCEGTIITGKVHPITYVFD